MAMLYSSSVSKTDHARVYYQPTIVSKIERWKDTLSLADFVTPNPWKGILPIRITTG